MATCNFGSSEKACLFFGDDGNGCLHQKGEGTVLTCGKRAAMDALEVDFKNPATDDLMLRTACCCYHCGLNTGEGMFAVRQGFNQCYGCYQGACILSCFDKSSSRASCFKSTSVGKACQCEFDENCLCQQDIMQLNCCFGIAAESISAMRLCDGSGSCCYGKAQNLCIYSKFAFPCNEEVSCELGLCGLMITNKKAKLQAWEAANPTLMGTGSTAASSGGAVTAAQVAPAKAEGAPLHPDAGVESHAMADWDLTLFPKVRVPGAPVRRVNWTM